MNNIDSDTLNVDEIRLGVLEGVDIGTLGTMYFDQFESWRENYIGLASVPSTANHLLAFYAIPEQSHLLPYKSAILGVKFNNGKLWRLG